MGRFNRIFEAVSKRTLSRDQFLELAKKSPFDAATSLTVVRGSQQYEREDLDPGVKFFILALEAAGLKTSFSCEGHQDGWYIVVDSDDLSVGKRLVDPGFFTVALEAKYESGYIWVLRRDFRDGNKEETLRFAAEEWVRKGLEPDWEKALEESNSIR